RHLGDAGVAEELDEPAGDRDDRQPADARPRAGGDRRARGGDVHTRGRVGAGLTRSLVVAHLGAGVPGRLELAVGRRAGRRLALGRDGDRREAAAAHENPCPGLEAGALPGPVAGRRAPGPPGTRARAWAGLVRVVGVFFLLLLVFLLLLGR